MKMNYKKGHGLNRLKSSKLYTAKDINKYLEIKNKTLYHWVQNKRLLKPKIEGIGRGKKNKFTLENLATLYLIKVLNNYRIDLWAIRDILKRISSPFLEEIIRPLFERKRIIIESKFNEKKHSKRKVNLWTAYKKGKKLFQKEGLFLIVSMSLEEKKVFYIIDDLIGAKKRLELMAKDKEGYEYLASMIFIDVVSIIKDLERKTGEEF